MEAAGGVISVVMPYWNRSFAMSRALALYAKWYADMDLELVIVDDGSSDKPHIDPALPFTVNLITLPAKDGPLNPCLPINTGMEAAHGDTLVLTNPEIIHHKPVLQEMRAELERLGADGYVLAAAYCREQHKWHCHSSVEHETKIPEGAGLHFCAMFNRSLWRKAGGFDPDYRQGYAFDDSDWVWRLHRAGAKFLIRDDLKVEHPKSGARVKAPFGAIERNAQIFKEKWPDVVADHP